MVHATPEGLLAGLSPAQRAAVASDASSLCVVAGAGSGKTTVLTRRVAFRILTQSARSEHVLVVTFTRKAATELRARLERLGVGAGVWAATFHSAAYSLLRRHWADEGRLSPAVVADPVPMLRRLLDDLPGAEPAMATTLATELSWCHACLVQPDDYAQAATDAGRSVPHPLEQMSLLMARYEQEKRRRGVMDLDDLVTVCAELMEAGGPAAEAMCWRLRHLFVDEFQDVNPSQWRLLEGWRRGRPDLFVVGDPRQAIYSWNGSDPTLLDRLPALIPGTAVIHLDHNHRCSPQIVSAARSVLPAAHSGQSVLGDAWSPAGAPDGAPDGPPPRLCGFDDQGAEASGVVRWLRTTRRPGRPWRQLAVLARTNARLTPVHEALIRCGIPVRRAGAPEAGAISAVLRVLRSVDRSMPLRAALVDVMAELEAKAAGEGSDLEPTPPPDRAVGRIPPDASLAARLEALADEHARHEGRANVGSFLAFLAANRAELDIGGDLTDGVELATFHQAKGLEWPAVGLVGLEAGIMPIAYATCPAALAEEQRLLYVAFTRAETQLWCSWVSRPSPFLELLRTTLTDQATLEPAEARVRVGSLRRRLAALAS
ncbi:MAG TPA: ATP-dependent helicase [Acidimicrobiales bacterium]|nr:ATP-dependent helicase [Acidimicrobiales bacterium]